MNEQSEKKLSELRRYYIKQLQINIHKQIFKIDAATDQSTLDELAHYLHKLAGSGGSFGLPVISKLSKAAEQLVTDPDLQSGPDSELKIEHTNALLQDLAAQISSLEHSMDEKLSSELGAGGHSAEAIKKDSNTPTLWLLDDDESLLTQLREQLLSFGFNVRVFTTFNELQQSWRSSQPDFLIADINLGGERNFYQLMTDSDIGLGSAALIVLSSFDNFEARIQAVRHHAITYLQKPVDTTKLAHLVQRHHYDKHPQPERVLLVDDDAELCKLYKVQLESAGMEVAILSDPRQVIAAIQAHRPELILIDLYMPKYSGMELASLIRQFDAYTSVPIVYLSSELNSVRQAQALERGADDFLTKPISEIALIAAVRTRVGRARELQALINKDGLTGLLKHSSIKDALTKELSRTARSKEPLCVAMLDIDYFKKINDNYGHAVGDTVIASLATLLSQRLRQSDHIGRYGGEEFLIIMPACSAESAQKILDDIRERFSAIQFISGSQFFTCRLSAGFVIASSQRVSDSSRAALIEKADEALYLSKENGRNKVTEAR